MSDVHKALSDAIRAGLPEWQPIETAPRDGTPFLAKGAGPMSWAVTVWEPVHRSWACAWDNWPIEEFAPTHWMPLPPPPQET